jgi:hypothetical protein
LPGQLQFAHIGTNAHFASAPRVDTPAIQTCPPCSARASHPSYAHRPRRRPVTRSASAIHDSPLAARAPALPSTFHARVATSSLTVSIARSTATRIAIRGTRKPGTRSTTTTTTTDGRGDPSARRVDRGDDDESDDGRPRRRRGDRRARDARDARRNGASIANARSSGRDVGGSRLPTRSLARARARCFEARARGF